MFDRLTAQDVANEISMLRSTFRGTFAVVEGITDARLYSKFMDKENVRTVIAYSKDNVRRAVNELRSRGDRKIMGIMDSDMDRLEGRNYLPPLFITDSRDLESMIMKSRAFDDVMSEYGDTSLLADYESRHGRVKDAVARASYPIGLLMFISKRDGLGLCFKDLDYSRFITGRTMEIDIRKMIEEVFSISNSTSAGRKALAEKIQAEEELLGDPWDAVRGHDAVSILCIGLDQSFGAYNSRGIKEGQLAGSMRLAFSCDDFRSTCLYKDTAAWSSATGNPLWLIPL